MTDHYTYTLVGQTPVPEPNLLTWAEWMKASEHRVGLTIVGPYKISTVFLGIDYSRWPSGPPILFETMIFAADKPEECDEDLPDYMRRYTTWDEAEKGHQETVAMIASRLKNAADTVL